MSSYFVGILLMILSGICYGFSPIFAVYAYQGGATVVGYVFLRYGIASVIYLLYMAIYKRQLFRTFRGKRVISLLAAGILQSVAAYLYMFTVINSSAGLAAILFYSYIVWVAVWGFIFNKERLNLPGITGVVVAFTGLILVVGVSWGKINTIGIIAGLVSALACSGFVMAGNSALRTMQPIAASGFISFFTATPLFLLGCVTGSLALSFQMSTVSWVACIGSGIITCNIALLAFMGGMKRVGSTTASVLCTVEPITVVVLSMFLLSQKMTILQLLGGLLIVIGAGLVVRYGGAIQKTAQRRGTQHMSV